MKDLLVAIWSYRQFIVSSIRNDFRSRFARSKLGALWMILQPLAQVAIYALVLSRVLAAKLPGVDSTYAYPIYLMAGMLGWTMFNELVMRSMTMFIDNANILKKIMFPRVCLPMIISGSALLNNFLLFIATIGVFATLGHWPTINIFWLIPLTLVNAAFGMGLGLIFGIVNVFLRDVAQVIGVILQLWFWLTPVVYMASIVPPQYADFLKINPMYSIVVGYQDVLLYGRAPHLHSLLIIGAISVGMLVFSLFLFRRASPEMVDVL